MSLYICQECGGRVTQKELDNGCHARTESFGGGVCTSTNCKYLDESGYDYDNFTKEPETTEEKGHYEYWEIPVDAELVKVVDKEAREKSYDCVKNDDGWSQCKRCGYLYFSAIDGIKHRENDFDCFISNYGTPKEPVTIKYGEIHFKFGEEYHYEIK